MEGKYYFLTSFLRLRSFNALMSFLTGELSGGVQLV